MRDLEKLMRATPLRKPDPSWKAIILSRSVAIDSGWSIGAKAVSSLVFGGCLAWGLTSWLWQDPESKSQDSPRAHETRKGVSTGLVLERGPRGTSLDWDAALLSEDDERFDEWQDPRIDVALADVHEVLTKFKEATLRRLHFPEIVPLKRIGITAEAIAARAHVALASDGEEEAAQAWQDCMTLFRLTHLLQQRQTMDAKKLAVGIAGIVIFPIGKGWRDHRWTEAQLASLQGHLLGLRSLEAIAEVAAQQSEAFEIFQDTWDPKYQVWVGLTNEDWLALGEKDHWLHRVITDSMDVDGRVRQTAIILALERYHRQHSELPEQIEDILSEMPYNPWTGAPFVYERTGPDEARLDGSEGSWMAFRPHHN